MTIVAHLPSERFDWNCVIADLVGTEKVDSTHLSEVIQYRPLDCLFHHLGEGI